MKGEAMDEKEKLEILQRCGFGGMDLSLLSKVKKPEWYGIQLTADASRSLGEMMRPDTKKSQNERIVEYAIRRGGITSFDATNILHIMSFTKRMSEIRRDPRYEVTDKWESNGLIRWKVYEIKEKDNV
jgi:hypothetical protein